MLRDETVLEPIFEDARLPELIDVLTVRWKNEQQLRAEFYEKIQPGDKWEFINGKIIMHSPAKDKHTDARLNLSYLMQTYVTINDLGKVRDETALVALTRNDYLPDILYFSKEKLATIQPNTWKYPIPDFVVEVLSDSTESKDRGIKKDGYASHGAREYWLIDTDLQVVEQYLLDEQLREFWLFTKKTIGDHVASRVIPGLNFPVAAIFDEKLKMEMVREWLR